MKSLAIYCADIGSIKTNNFGWARGVQGEDTSSSADISELPRSVAADLNADRGVALGFECPLYVPIADDPRELTSQRRVDQGRPWSASAGATVLATGLTETVWILHQIRMQLRSSHPAFLSWADFSVAQGGLFLWEAMVTGEAKGTSHREDAEIGVRAFQRRLVKLQDEPRSEGGGVYSLIGAALLRTGWTDDVSLLSKPCVVIRAQPPA